MAQLAKFKYLEGKSASAALTINLGVTSASATIEWTDKPKMSAEAKSGGTKPFLPAWLWSHYKGTEDGRKHSNDAEAKMLSDQYSRIVGFHGGAL